MTALYQGIVLDRVRHPRHAGVPAQFEAQGRAANTMCGDKVHVYLAKGMDVRHVSEGCAIMAASADLMSDATKGKTPEQIMDISKHFTAAVTTGVEDEALGELNAFASVAEFPSRIGCATLPWRALEEALQNV